MSSHWISIYALVGMFVLATVLPINMGVIAFVGAFLVGTLVAGMNISRGGIAIRTTSPLDLGAKVRTRFRLPGSKRDIDAEELVAWSDKRHGMGLQFEKVDAPDQAAIDEFVDAHFFSSRKG